MYNENKLLSLKKNKSGAVIIYVVFLLTISLTLATIIFDSFILLTNEKKINSIESNLFLNINKKFNLVLNNSDYFNNNGSGFVDIVSCPKDFTMSGSINTGLVSTYSTFDNGNIFCSGSYLGDTVLLYFNDTVSDLSGAIYKGNSVVLNLGTQSNTFSDGDSTNIDVSTYSFVGSDNIDDNMNSDDFLPGSNGTTSYANGYIDDDIMSRLLLNGYVLSGEDSNIFWSNSDIGNYINNNSNNYTPLKEKMSNVDTGTLILDVNSGSTLTILNLDKSTFDTSRDLVVNNILSGFISTGSGYIQNNAGVLSLSTVKTGNEYLFNFISDDYALFLDNTGTGILKYNLMGETYYGTGIYIVPFNDSSDSVFSYLGNDIINYNGKYVGKIQELKKYLKFGNGIGNNEVIVTYLGGRRWSDGSIAKTCKDYINPPIGYLYQGAGGDGYYFIKPGAGTFLTYCDMTTSGGGWTKVLIANGTRFQENGAEITTLLKTFTYDLSSSNINLIKGLSTSFMQYFKKECLKSVAYSDGSTLAQIKWKRYGSSTLFLGNEFPNYNICDSNNNVASWFESSGYIYDENQLPIEEIHGGDTGAPDEDSYYEFGDFYMR